MAATLPGDGGWIVSTSLDKPDPKTRRLIRSHVMRGKNTREDRKVRKQAKKRASGSDTSLESPNEDPEWVMTSPRKVASEISTFGYGFNMMPYMEELVYRGKFNLPITVLLPFLYIHAMIIEMKYELTNQPSPSSNPPPSQ